MYGIAKFEFCIRNLTRDQSAERLIPFLCDAGDPETEYEIVYSRDLSSICRGERIGQTEAVLAYRDGDRLFCAYHHQGRIYAVCEETPGKVFLHLQEEASEHPWHHYFLPDLLHLERPLAERDCFVLHSSYVSFGDDAILFTAPSGGGKTTQAELWISHLGASVINGDKTAIGKTDGKWFAYGLPISGSSPYCLNETHPVRAIVILEKAPRNQLIEIGIAGFSRILSQTILNTWDEKFCGKVMDLVTQACQEIPIYLFRCTKTEDAAYMLHDVLYKKESAYGTQQ